MHLIQDNLATHTTPTVQAWLTRHERIVSHTTPTSASWMNQIETTFSILTRQAIRRDSVTDRSRAIDEFTRAWNENAEPFAWVKTADQTLAKAIRKADENSGAGH